MRSPAPIGPESDTAPVSAWIWVVAAIGIVGALGYFFVQSGQRPAPPSSDRARVTQGSTTTKATSSNPPSGDTQEEGAPSDDSSGDETRVEEGDATTEDEGGPPADPALAAQMDEARKLYRRRDTRKAKAKVEAVLDVEPDHVGALVLLSNLLIEEGEIDKALAPARRAAFIDSEFPDAHLALGVVRQERGNLEGALDSYSRYLELQPKGQYAESIRREVKRLQKRLAEKKP
jgi:Flp pilus assembly protein TadD